MLIDTTPPKYNTIIIVIIVVIGYAIGSAFINKTNVNPFIKKILSIGIGWIGITLFIFIEIKN